MRKILLLALFLPVLAFGRESATSWPSTLTPHFEIHHQSVWLPGGFVMGVERIHSRLRLDLAGFSPWMSNERVKLLLYAGQKEFQAGELGPPAWSNGLAFYQQKLVAVYDQKPSSKLLQIVAHETTHLLFESYWGEAGKKPPSWLNEGLAMLEETDSLQSPESSEWYQSMRDSAGNFPPLTRFMGITPAQDLADSSSSTVSLWYAQAYSVVYFLVRKHSRLQFKTFVAHLRDGDDVQKALWESYGYLSLEKFESDWRQWLGQPAGQAKTGLSSPRFGQIDGFKPLQ